MDAAAWKRRNAWHRIAGRLKHPWPFYKRAGGINAVVIRAGGKREDLGRVSDTFLKRKGWSVGTK